MGKRKEIKFLCKDGRTLEGRQDGVEFWIRKDTRRERDGLPAYVVAANDTKGKNRTIYTSGHEYFTLEGAKEFCQQIMAGEIDLEERNRKYLEETEAKEKREKKLAIEKAAAFKDKLDAAGISYSTLLDLANERDGLNGMTHAILLEWEHEEGAANG